MKLMNIKAFAIMALLSVTGYSFGYQYGISNGTDKPLIVRVQERQMGVVDQYAIIESLEKRAFNFEGAMCLLKIQAAPFNPEKRWQKNDRFKGKNLLEIQNMGVFVENGKYDVEAFRAFGELVRTVALIDVEMKMEPNAVFADTAKAAAALVTGLDDLACKVTDIALKAYTGGLAGVDSTVINDVKNIVQKPLNEIKDEQLNLAEAKDDLAEKPNDPKAKEAAEKAAAALKIKERPIKLTELSREFTDLVIKEGLYVKEPVSAASALVDKNKELLGIVAAGQMGTLFSQGKNREAMKILADLTKKAKEEASTTTSIESEVIIRGCSNCDINTYVDEATTKPTWDPKKGLEAVDLKKTCSFGLGAIAKASADLTEQSICQNRDFLLIPSGTKVGAFEKLWAVTKKGE